MKRITKMTMLFLTISAMLLLLTAPALADVAATGDYNWQETNFFVEVDAENGLADLYYGPGLEFGKGTVVENGTELNVHNTADNYLDQLHWGQVWYSDAWYWIDLNQTIWVSGDPDASVTDVLHYVKTINGMEYVFFIPAVNLDSEEIHALNAEIFETYHEDAESSIEIISQKGDLPASDMLQGVAYEYFVSDDILSLIIASRTDANVEEYQNFQVYLISIPDAKVLDRGEFLEKLGLTQEEYEEAVITALEGEFADEWSFLVSDYLYEEEFSGYEEFLSDEMLAEEYYDTMFDEPTEWMETLEEKYNEILQKAQASTLDPENIREAMPYLDDYGDMNLIIKIYLGLENVPYVWSVFPLAL